MSRRPARAATPGYAPSWFDALTDWIDAAPRSRSWVYVAIWAAAFGLLVGPRLRTAGWSQVGLIPFHLVLSGTAAYMLFFMHVTKRGFVAALTALAPSVRADASTFAGVSARVTTTPALPTFAFGVFGAAVGTALLWPLASRPETALLGVPSATAALLALIAATSFVIATYACRAAYRMVGMQRLYALGVDVDLLSPEPLFAHSAVTARGSLSLILYSLAWVVTVPGGLTNVGFLAIALLVNLLAVVLYLLPLWRVHQLLVAEKRRLLVAAYREVQTVGEALHQRTRQGAFADLDGLSKGMVALQTEIALIERVSTWPWHPELARLVVTALLAPLIAWLAQRLLQGWF